MRGFGVAVFFMAAGFFLWVIGGALDDHADRLDALEVQVEECE